MGKRNAFAASLLAAVLATASLAVAEPAEPVEDVYAAIIEIWPLKGEYSGSYWPPGCDEEGAICLGANVLIQKGGIERFVGAPLSRADRRLRSAQGRDADGSYVRLRLIAGHARIRVPPGRYVAVLEPTDEGYVFVQWRGSLRGTRACFPRETLQHYGDRLLLTLGPPDGEGRRCEA
jgi:hypothetical protein